MRRRFTFVSSLVSMIVFLAAPGAARAGTVDFAPSNCNKYGCSSIEVRFRAFPGEANRVTLGPSVRYGTYVRDVGAPLTPQGCGELASCSSLDAHTVFTPDAGSPFSGFLGDGNDAFTAATYTIPAGVLVYGGPGDDAMVGSGLDDVLAGGAGTNFLAGGAGSDTADYGSHALVDLAQGLGRAPGERDALSSIENANGGGTADVLKGTDGPNVLNAAVSRDKLGRPVPSGPVPDVAGRGRGGGALIGRGGDDALTGVLGGPTTFSAGAGNDVLRALDPRDRLFCGPGDDVVELGLRLQPPPPDVVVGADCELVALSGTDFFRASPSTHGLTFTHGRMIRERLVLTARLAEPFPPSDPFYDACYHVTLSVGKPGGPTYGRVHFTRSGRLAIRLGPQGRRDARNHRLVELRTSGLCGFARDVWRIRL